MSVGSTTRLISYTIDDTSTAPLAVDFRFDAESWLNVYYVPVDGESATLLILGSDYTIGGNGVEIEGTVTLTASFLASITTGQLTIARLTPALQTLDLVYNTRQPSLLIEKALDWQAMALQDRDPSPGGIGGRAIVMPVTEPPSNSNVLAIPEARKGKPWWGNPVTGNLEFAEMEDFAPAILAYYGITITTDDVLAAISAIAPLFRATPPDSSTEGKGGQLAIVPEYFGVTISGALNPDATGPLLPWKTDGTTVQKVWFTTTGENPQDNSGVVYQLAWTNVFTISEFSGGVPTGKAWIALNGNSGTTAEGVNSWLALGGATGSPVVTVTDLVPARVWVNLSQTGEVPNWQEIPADTDISNRYNLDSPVIENSGSAIGFGDSRTYGTNFSGGSYTTGGRINAEYRWLDIVATSQGRSLTVENYGIPSGKISGVDASASIWNATGQTAYDWTGVFTSFNGYNNCDANTDTPQFYSVMEQAFTAFAVRGVIDGYAGIGILGYGHQGSTGGTLHNFTTTGANNAVAVAPGDAAISMPFYYGDPDGDRLQVHLTNGEYAEWTLRGMSACGIVLESDNAGGPWAVTVNGQVWASGNSEYDNLGGNDPAGHRYPLGYWIKDLPQSAIIRITCTGAGTVRLQGYGWVEASSTLVSQRSVIIAGPGGDNLNRPLEIMRQLGECARAAVSKFEGYPVYAADTFSLWLNSENNEPADISHLSIRGNQFVADAIMAARKQDFSANTPRFTDQKRIRQESSDVASIYRVDMDPSKWAATAVGSGSLPTGTGSANLNLRAGNTASASILASNNVNGALLLVAPIGNNYNYTHWNFATRIVIEFVVTNTSANSVFRVLFGTVYNNSTISDLTDSGVGIKIENTSLKIQTHNGTTLTNSAAVGTITAGLVNRVILDTDGDGGIVATLNGLQVYSSTTAPSTADADALRTGIECSSTNGSDAAFAIMTVNQIIVSTLPDT